MPHPGHFIACNSCRFHLNTYVGGYIVSTVGEYYPRSSNKMETLGCGEDSFYETMVFKAEESEYECCPYSALVTQEQECERYATAEEAMKGHMKLCKSYARRK